jgi:hypothetical protein
MIEIVFGLVFWKIGKLIDKQVEKTQNEKARKQRNAELFKNDRPVYTHYEFEINKINGFKRVF